MKNAAVTERSAGASQSRKHMRNFTSGTPSERWLGPASPNQSRASRGRRRRSSMLSMAARKKPRVRARVMGYYSEPESLEQVVDEAATRYCCAMLGLSI